MDKNKEITYYLSIHSKAKVKKAFFAMMFVSTLFSPNVFAQYGQKYFDNNKQNACYQVAAYVPPNYNKCSQIGQTPNGVPIWSCC